MHTVYGPRIYVIGRTQLNWAEIDDYLDDEGTEWIHDLPRDGTHDLELASEFAGRVCYAAFGKAQYHTETGKYLENILTQRHGSVLEHATLMLLITGVSRSLTHELVRHRVGVAYSQRSQRYVDESKTPGYVLPPELSGSIINADDNETDKLNAELRSIWLNGMQHTAQTYEALTIALTEKLQKLHPDLKKRDLRIRARQAARSVLPNAMETTIVVTANMRTLRHLCEIRGGVGAESEIRRLAIELTHVLRDEAPAIAADLEVTMLEDGRPGVRVKHSKV